MEKLIHLRPHHLLCLQAFRGKGYSEDFVKKMTEVLNKLLENGSAPESVTGIPASLALTGDLVRSCCPDCQWQEICLEVCNT